MTLKTKDLEVIKVETGSRDGNKVTSCLRQCPYFILFFSFIASDCKLKWKKI